MYVSILSRHRRVLSRILPATWRSPANRWATFRAGTSVGANAEEQGLRTPPRVRVQEQHCSARSAWIALLAAADSRNPTGISGASPAANSRNQMNWSGSIPLPSKRQGNRERRLVLSF